MTLPTYLEINRYPLGSVPVPNTAKKPGSADGFADQKKEKKIRGERNQNFKTKLYCLINLGLQEGPSSKRRFKLKRLKLKKKLPAFKRKIY